MFAHATDLLDIYHRAQDNDLSFQSAVYSLEAAKQKLPEAVSALLPSIGANATGGETAGNTTYTAAPKVGRNYKSYTWTVQLTQPLFRAQNLVAYGEAEALAEQAVARFEQARQDLMVRVAQAYFDVLIAEDALTSAQSEQRATEEQLVSAQHNYDAGVSAITDVYEAKAHAASSSAQRVLALDDLEIKRAELEKITGTVAYLKALGPDFQVMRPNPEDVHAWMARASDNNPVVLALKAAADAARSEVSKAQYQRLPSIDLVASIGGNYSSGNINNPVNYGTRADDRQVGLQMSMPIMDGGGIHAQVLEAKANLGKAETDYRAARRQSATDARVAYSGIIHGIALIDALNSSAAFSQSSVKGNRVGYSLGIRINSNVLDAEQQLYATQRDLSKARYETLMQCIKLKAAVGTLGETDLASINRWLTARSSVEESESKSDQAVPTVTVGVDHDTSKDNAAPYKMKPAPFAEPNTERYEPKRYPSIKALNPRDELLYAHPRVQRPAEEAPLKTTSTSE